MKNIKNYLVMGRKFKIANMLYCLLLSFVFLFSFCPSIEQEVASETYDWWWYNKEPYYGGGTEADPYIIDTPEKYAMVTHNTFTGIDLDAYFKITKNLDLGAHLSYPIGYNQKFSGTIDGNYCTISNLRLINGWSGLVEIMSYGTIKNLGLTNIMVNKDYEGGCVGSFCGFMEYSTIINCFVSGGYIKSGGENVGGIVGKSEHTSITNTYIAHVDLSMTPVLIGVMYFGNVAGDWF